MNSIISWVGGKKALRDLIYLRMPKNYDRYIEVFGGGGWGLFGETPDKCMEVYNDFNSNLANLFYCVKERPMALLRELSFLPLNSRDEFTTLRKFLTMEEFKSEHLAEELEIATHFLKEPEATEIRDILMERAAVGDVKRAAAFYKIPPEKTIIIFDDISLDVGKMRIRRKGSDGGHNGIKSIIYLTGSDQFPRIKVGVGKKPHPDYDLAAWVLGHFSAEELKMLEEVYEHCYQALGEMLKGNIDRAMNLFN